MNCHDDVDKKLGMLQAMHAAYHNRDVELTDLLTELYDKFKDQLSDDERARILRLTCDDSRDFNFTGA